MISEADIMGVVEHHCLAYMPRVLPRGHVRVDTKLLYPDGASISVFVEQGNLKRVDGLAISDFGKTLQKLAEYDLDPWRPERMKTIREMVGPLGVSIMNDRLVIEIGEVDHIHDAIISLSQACLRTSCLVFNRRAKVSRSLATEIHKIVQGTGLTYQERFAHEGPYQIPVNVDYRVMGPSKSSSLLKLGGSHTQANEVLRRWVDLKTGGVADHFVTVYDEKEPVERNEDLERLREYSTIFTLGNRAELTNFLRRAA